MTTAISTKQDILNQLLTQGQATAQALADRLAVSPQAIRRHLKDLQAEALVEFETVREGMGRPQHVYRLSRAGRDRFDDRYDRFALDLLGTVAETMGPEQMDSLLRKQWERKTQEYQRQLGSGSLAERVAGLVQIRQSEGYMAEYYPIPKDADPATATRFILAEHNCVISNVAESFPNVCNYELKMFAAALKDCQVERTHWLVNGEHRCGYLIQAK